MHVVLHSIFSLYSNLDYLMAHCCMCALLQTQWSFIVGKFKAAVDESSHIKIEEKIKRIERHLINSIQM